MGRWANKYVIGLTGNIAMGKSTVRKMLENLGAYTIDADALSHQAMAPGAPAYAPVIAMFGKWVLGADGRIDRARLGAIVFSHADALNELEKLTHPVVSQAVDLLVSRATQPVVVVEAIKVIDGSLGSQVDSIWVVDASVDSQVKRLMSRRNLTEAEARQRIEAQNSQTDKLSRADVVIHNNGSPEELMAQVQQEWDKITERSAPKPVPAPMTPVNSPPPTTMILPKLQPTALTSPSTKSMPAPLVTRQLTPQTEPVQAERSIQSPIVATSPGPVVQPAKSVSPTGRLTMPGDGSNATIQVEIRRGMPKHTEAIARLMSQATRRAVTSSDVTLLFGEKSFFLADSAGRSIGLISFHVENLIALISEVIVAPEVPAELVINGLVTAVETAARSLQSEVAFTAIMVSTPSTVVQAFQSLGYDRITVDSLRIPAWREAASEMQVPGSQILMKRLRDSLVLTPV